MPVLSAHDVARELRSRLPGLPAKKLHKLLYFAQGHHLAVFGEVLFSESISAWDMGPVVGQLWHQEKTSELPDHPNEPDEAQLNTIGYTVSRYGALSGGDLERLTHAESPWRDADLNRRPGTSARIPNEAIRAYFRSPDSDEEEVPAVDTDELSVLLQEAAERDTSASPDSLPRLRALLIGD